MGLYYSLLEQSRATAYSGSRRDAKMVLQTYGLTHRRWTTETMRARWDGAAALLDWWHALEPSKRPPLDNLRGGNARAFISTLEKKGLTRSTIKGYRMGASALTKALHWGCGGQEQPDTTYNPFRDILPAQTEHKPPQIDREKLEAIDDIRTRAKLEALLALLNLGLSVPEACTRYWSDVSIRRRELTRYHRQRIEIHAEAVEALETLWAVLPRSCQSANRRIFGWTADTARRWLKGVRVD
jgi:hypothetical protein